MPAEAPRAILLDALGTLVGLEPPAPLLRAELARRFQIYVSEAEAQRALAAEIAYYRAHLDEGRNAAGLTALRARCAEVLRGALPPDRRIAAVSSAALTDALLAALQFSPFPDAAPALARAREGGVRLVVVSNWDVSLTAVLERTGLARTVDGIVASAAVGARKPDPAIFEHALAMAGVPARAAVHVGDSLEEDVAGARAAGVEPILIRRDGRGGPAGVRTVADLFALGDLARARH